jgi:hypothetical protein
MAPMPGIYRIHLKADEAARLVEQLRHLGGSGLGEAP